MNFFKLSLATLATFFALTATPPAEAHGRGGVSLHFGVPFGYWGGYWGPRYYYAPSYDYYYAPAPVIVERPAAPTYIEREEIETSSRESPPARAENWWYWCPDSRKYHPYVRECPGGFERVPPQN